MNKFIVFIVWIMAWHLALGHIGHSHEKKTDSLVEKGGKDTNLYSPQREEVYIQDEEKEFSYMDEFPTLHPLVVHFPIVLLILGAFLQIVSLFTTNKLMNYIILAIFATGAITGFIAGNFVHPHTSSDAPQIILNTLEKHEEFAQWSVILAFIATALKIMELKFSKIKWLTAIVAIAAAVAVSVAGHHGAELTHKMGVGAKGQYLELH